MAASSDTWRNDAKARNIVAFLQVMGEKCGHFFPN
jgi:6-phosphofructokinase